MPIDQKNVVNFERAPPVLGERSAPLAERRIFGLIAYVFTINRTTASARAAIRGVPTRQDLNELFPPHAAAMA
jgi:hypothetical protein